MGWAVETMGGARAMAFITALGMVCTSAAAAVAGGLHEDDVMLVMQGVTICVVK